LSLWKEADLEQIDAAREQALRTEGFELLVELVGRDFEWPNYTKELQDQEKPKAEVIQLKEKVTTPDAEKLTAVVALVQDLLKDYDRG